MTGTISVEGFSGDVSLCGRLVGGITVADSEGITDPVMATVALDGVGSVGQSVGKNNVSLIN